MISRTNTTPVDREVTILGVQIADVTVSRAIDIIEGMICNEPERTHSIYFVNAHTLNLAQSDPGFRDVLNSGDYVFGDGTGVRWAARLQGIRVQDNLVGTDLVPSLFRYTAGSRYSYFMLGSDQETVERAARYARQNFGGWKQAGTHHGYLQTEEITRQAIEQINAARPHVLLVGMGNPRQERWILEYKHELRVPVVMGIGGLYDYWADNVSRAPLWLRQLGHEWLWRLYQQPRDKAKRYLVGNPVYLYHVCREEWQRRRHVRPMT
jgi:N-acetylglucosaminyldiphosphoundecaprenol N-acetyl-beta-D-mannosaminyltransferase